MLLGLLAASVGVIALIAKIKKRKQRAPRRFWVNPYLLERSEKGRYGRDVSITISFTKS